MKTTYKLAASILALSLGLSAAHASEVEAGKSLLTKELEALTINKIDIGDFHFRKGQIAPIHTHVAPVFATSRKDRSTIKSKGRNHKF